MNKFWFFSVVIQLIHSSQNKAQNRQTNHTCSTWRICHPCVALQLVIQRFKAIWVFKEDAFQHVQRRGGHCSSQECSRVYSQSHSRWLLLLSELDIPESLSVGRQCEADCSHRSGSICYSCCFRLHTSKREKSLASCTSSIDHSLPLLQNGNSFLGDFWERRVPIVEGAGPSKLLFENWETQPILLCCAKSLSTKWIQILDF